MGTTADHQDEARQQPSGRGADRAPVAGLVLSAGAGSRLAPLTLWRAKPLCPLGGRALVDHALDRFEGVVEDRAVNVHHHRGQFEEHFDGRREHLSHEERPLGSAGAVGLLRDWVDGRGLVVLNGDTWCPDPVARLLDGWDGEEVRVLAPGGLFGPKMAVAGTVLPWRVVRDLPPTFGGLWDRCWEPARAAGRLTMVPTATGVPFVDCATVHHYLLANLTWSGGESVIGEGAVVEGTVERSVVWPGTVVPASVHLSDAVATPHGTVLCRRVPPR